MSKTLATVLISIILPSLDHDLLSWFALLRWLSTSLSLAIFFPFFGSILSNLTRLQAFRLAIILSTSFGSVSSLSRVYPFSPKSVTQLLYPITYESSTNLSPFYGFIHYSSGISQLYFGFIYSSFGHNSTQYFVAALTISTHPSSLQLNHK